MKLWVLLIAPDYKRSWPTLDEGGTHFFISPKVTSRTLKYTPQAGRGASSPKSSTLGDWGGRSPEVRRPAWPKRRNPVSTKNTKIGQARWHTRVIPTTREAEAGESLEPGRRRLHWAEIALLYSSLATERDSVSKKKKRKKRKGYTIFHFCYWECPHFSSLENHLWFGIFNINL